MNQQVVQDLIEVLRTKSSAEVIALAAKDGHTAEGATACRYVLTERQLPLPAPVPHLRPVPGAGFGIRAVARVLDGLCWCGLTIVAMHIAVLIMRFQGTHGDPDDWIRTAGGLGVAGVVLAWLAGCGYHVVSEWLGGASVGKVLCGLRVVAVDGRRVRLRGAVIRYLAMLIDGLFLGLVAYGTMEAPRMQRLGDQWGRTMVVWRRHVAPEARAGGWRLTLGLVLGSGLWMAPTIYHIVSCVVCRLGGIRT